MVAMLGLEVRVLAQLHTFCKSPAASVGACLSSGSLQPSRSAHVEAYITGKTVVPSDRMTRAPPDTRP